MDLNENKSELAGAIMGDGNLWTDNRHYRVELTGDPELDREYYKYLTRLMQEEFGEDPTWRTRQKGLRLRVCSKEFFNYFNERLGLPSGSQKSRKVRVPDPIISADWSIERKCIRGLADTDGSVFFSEKGYRQDYPTIEITTTSHDPSNQLENLLEDRGFRVGLRRWEHEEDWNTRFVISINGEEMVKKWVEEIGFSNPRHYKKINNIRL